MNRKLFEYFQSIICEHLCITSRDNQGMKKKIDISGIDPLSFTGMNDQNLRFIENKFDSNIIFKKYSIYFVPPIFKIINQIILLYMYLITQ